MAKAKSLSAPQIRSLARKHAAVLAHELDTSRCGYNLDYDDACAAIARRLVDHASIFCDLVCAGTGASDAEVQSTAWPAVVKVGCEVIEATREAWRPAWQNGFLQAILRDELAPFSSFVRGVAR